MNVLRTGDRVRFDGQEHTVVGLSGTAVRLVGDDAVSSVVSVGHLQSAPDFDVVATAGGAYSPALLASVGRLESVPDSVLERARWWEGHIAEVETGLPPGASSEARPRPEYDPATTTLADRDAAKAAELTALGYQVSSGTIRRRRSSYATSGLWGLIDQRAMKANSPTGRVDDRVVDAVRQAMAEETTRSSGTRVRLRRRVEQVLAERYPDENVPLPPKTTFYRLVAGLDRGGHTFGPATTRRSLANRPDGPFGTQQAVRPGQLVQTDTTPLDVMAVLDDGVPGRVELTTLVDLATRTISAAVLRPAGTKAVDAALLLARALVPEPMRPGWAESLQMRASRLPYRELVEVDERFNEAAAKPVIVPETIVCDRGAVYLSETFLAACARLGISVQPAHPRTPTDKGVVERTFSSINTLFCQYIAGYVGRDVTRRGTQESTEAVWSISDLQDLLDEWILIGWQQRPHDGLRHPDVPKVALSPNDMYAALVASAGYLPLSLSAEDYLELLPVEWRRITAQGVRLGYLTYDSPELNPYRGQLSGISAKNGRWEVRYDPYDLSQVWVRAADSTGWITVPWIHQNRVPAPFADYTLRHIKRLIQSDPGAVAGDENAIAAALESLLSRGEMAPPIDKATRRIAARTHAAARTSLEAPGSGRRGL
ncbi:Mu transposase C-terminal domain-containing protein [Saccharopolyspora shandongensis]|uniref:Mu transposase C-terminal domain-containing protein n=1 Tax=Saccharopolyspora shandongensis TaxID=418495 RepID=UPI0033C6F51F